MKTGASAGAVQAAKANQIVDDVSPTITRAMPLSQVPVTGEDIPKAGRHSHHAIRDQLLSRLRDVKRPIGEAIEAIHERLRHPHVMEHFGNISDQALDERYHYGLSPRGSFGHAANGHTASAVIKEVLALGKDCFDESKRAQVTERLARAAHDGWGYAVRNTDDPSYSGNPDKKQRRLALADTPYDALIDEEKEKDRVAALAILADFDRHGGLENWLDKVLEKF